MIHNLEQLIASGLCVSARLITGVRAVWRGCPPIPRQRIYFANHASHFDFVLIWATLPPPMRRMTRPVAALDYWGANGLRHYLITRVFNGVLIDRKPPSRHINPLRPMVSALASEDSLILFPEGTRNPGGGVLPFKPGLFHLAKEFPEVELVPVWIENVGRVMPKGTLIPVPLICSLSFGQPVTLAAGESKPAFLERARQALLALAPPPD
jgi:1-acyl-sn-glycerol-3-phosphate acyltransferase